MTSPNTTWRIDYDPDSDNGFRLYNIYQRCYLASSFRLYPDWDGERGNDTVDAQIHQYVEATCTRFASVEASTLFLVEGKIPSLQSTTTYLLLFQVYERNQVEVCRDGPPRSRPYEAYSSKVIIWQGG